MHTSHLPFRGPKREQNCYATPTFSRVPNAKQGEQNQKWLPSPCLLGGPKKSISATYPLHSRRSPTPSADTKSELPTSPLPPWGSKRGWTCYVTTAFSGVPNKIATKSEVAASPLPSLGPERGRNCYLTPTFLGGLQRQWRGGHQKLASSPLAFSGARKRVELLRNPCTLKAPQRQVRGENQKGLPQPCLVESQKEGGTATCYITHAFSGVPNDKRGEKIRRGYLTPACSGAQRRAEVQSTTCVLRAPQSKGNKTRSGYLTLAFSKTQKRAELLHNPCILRGAQR